LVRMSYSTYHDESIYERVTDLEDEFSKFRSQLNHRIKSLESAFASLKEWAESEIFSSIEKMSAGLNQVGRDLEEISKDYTNFKVVARKELNELESQIPVFFERTRQIEKRLLEELSDTKATLAAKIAIAIVQMKEDLKCIEEGLEKIDKHVSDEEQNLCQKLEEHEIHVSSDMSGMQQMQQKLMSIGNELESRINAYNTSLDSLTTCTKGEMSVIHCRIHEHSLAVDSLSKSFEEYLQVLSNLIHDASLLITLSSAHIQEIKEIAPEVGERE